MKLFIEPLVKLGSARNAGVMARSFGQQNILKASVIMNSKKFRSAVAGLVCAGALAIGSAFAAEKDLTATLQERVAALSPEQQKALLAFIDQFAAKKGGETAEQAVQRSLEEYKKAVSTKSFKLEDFTSKLSKDFQHPVVGGRDGAIQWAEGIFNSGFVTQNAPDVTFDISHAKYTTKGDTVEVYPVDAQASIGSASLTIYLKNEGGEWRVTGVDGL